MQISLYNTLSRQIEVFQPFNPEQVGIYSCGPTVYGAPHIGNMRKYFLDDLIKNVIKHIWWYNVTHVVNITDVGHLTGENEGDADHGEDKMEKWAKREGLTAWDVAKKYETLFHENCRLLKLDPFDYTPRATEHIAEQIDMVAQLEAKGYTYTIEGDGIYMDTSKVADYGKLMGANYKKHVEGLNAGERIDMGGRKNPTDFALWKFNMTGKKRDMEWESPRGIGFPGWHIECSAMSIKYLGNHFDIHTGGIDHIPVHHSNEIAQSECSCTTAPWVKYWLHYQFLNINWTKISKSIGNVVTVEDVLNKGYSAEDLRYFYLMAQYSKDQNFTWEGLESAKVTRKSLKEKLKKYALLEQVSEKKSESYKLIAWFLALNFDTVSVLTKLHEIIRDLVQVDVSIVSSLGESSTILSDLVDIKYIDTNILKLGLFDPEKEIVLEIPSDIQALAEQRRQAKTDKNWELADSLRKELEDKGWEMKDGKEDYELVVK